MEKPEIQELLEGMLNDEQTAEVLHRMSVSPEKLSEFRQHMALRGEMARDARGEGLTEEEDDRLWAAVLGATGGLVTGGTAVGTGVWTWLGRGAALLVTGLAGFFIGSAINGDDAATADAATNATPPPIATVEQNADASGEALPGWLIAAADRVDTVYVTRTVVEYRDRDGLNGQDGREEMIAEAHELESPDGMPEGTVAQANVDGDESNATGNGQAIDFGYYESTERYHSSNPLVPTEYLGVDQVAVSENRSNTARSDTDTEIASADLAPEPDPVRSNDLGVDPNTMLDEKMSEEKLNERSPESRDQDLIDVPTHSLMQNRIEIGYAERLGRVAPAPEVNGRSQPAFDARSIDITYRDFGGRLGAGIRLLYGAFSEINYERTLNFDLGLIDTIYTETLGSADEFSAQVFFNYRIPLGSERLALGLEASWGFSSSERYTLGGNSSVIYLITDWLGVQAGAGFGSYWYQTDAKQESSLEDNFNGGVPIGQSDRGQVRGTMLEGRYGLFYRF